MRFSILQAFYGHVWSILPEKLHALEAVLQRHADGVRLDAESIEAAVPSRGAPAAEVVGNGVAVIPVFGTIAQRMPLLLQSSGGASAETTSRQLQMALADPDVKSILFRFDSPGGSVFGIPELAASIRDAAQRKRVVASVDPMAASAAYWLASATSEIAITPSGVAGSIGVLALHVDETEADAQQGRRVTIVSAGKYKAETNSHAPLTDDARGALQQQVDRYYSAFVSGVARGRGVPVDTVRKGFGEGRVLTAKDAVEAGLVDRVETFDETLTRLSNDNGRQRARAVRAEQLAGRIKALGL